MLIEISIIMLAYLVGSIASAIIVCRIMQLEDPRHAGSNNPGATNVLRLHGKKAALFTLLGDVLKGYLPVMLASLIGLPDLFVALTGFFAFIGHVYPVFFKFKGGKGVATFIGVLFGTVWWLGFAFVITWMIIAIIFRYSSLSALTASALTPVFSFLLLHSYEYTIIHTLMVCILFWRHRSNISNLVNGKEQKIRFSRF